MKSIALSAVVALATISPAFAQVAETRIVYEASNEYFRSDVAYSRQVDGREHCSAALLDRETSRVLIVHVPGDRREPGVITFTVPRGTLGFGGPPEASDLSFWFVEQGGEPAYYSGQGFWDGFSVEEVHQGMSGVSHVMLISVDDLWAFARDWYDSANLVVTTSDGVEMGSMTLYRSQELVQALADCWSGTEGE